MSGTESVATKVNFHQGYLALYHHSDIRNLSAEQLQYTEGRTFTRVWRIHRTCLE